MPARTRRTAAPVPTPEPEPVQAEETVSQKRGPSELSLAHAAWIKAEYNVTIDPEALYLAQTTRREFRASQDYQDALDRQEAAREKADADKAERASARAAAKAAEPAPAAAEPEAKPARRTRAAKAAAEPVQETEAPVETTRTRSRRRGTAATTPAAEPEAAPAEAKPTRSRKAPF